MSAYSNTPLSRMYVLKGILISLRPSQWTKNGILFAAFVFGYGDKSLNVTLYDAYKVIPAFLVFCLATGAVYILNDLIDRKSDQLHPKKRYRPIAAGNVSTKIATYTAITLGIFSILVAYVLSFAFMQILVLYIILQLLYCGFLKKIALLDVFIISAGFVLRAIAGAVLLDVPISPWLLVCTFLLALFLALCKRRHEKGSIEAGASARQRMSLQKYDIRLTDQLISIVAAATIVTYAIYTLWPDTLEKFGSGKLAYTLPIVMFGIFRYLDLLYRENKGDRPEEVLLTDVPIICTVLIYVAAVITLFVLPQ